MWSRVKPLARCYVYRALTRLPHERLMAWRARRSGRAMIRALQRCLGNGPIEVARGTGLTAGLLLDGRALSLMHIQVYGLVRGALEPGVQEALRRHVAPGSVVYDVGANIGFFSLVAARLAGPSGQVAAFEPVAATAAALRRNLVLNDAGTVHVHEAAVGARSERSQLLSVDEPSWSHLADRGCHTRTQDVVEVDVVTLDELVAAGLASPDVVKIDVEGSEVDVLEGMAETVRLSSPVIICELHDTNAEFVARMRELGYVTQNLDGAEPVARAGAVHALARPRARWN